MDNCKKWAEALIGKPIVAFDRAAAGRNSRVFRARTADGAAYALKQYLVTPERNGLETEFSALQFLHTNGIGKIPRAIACDRTHHLAVYDFIEGAPVGDAVAPNDLDAAVEFVLVLDRLSQSNPAWKTNAAEACFALNDAIENINARLRRLTSLREDSPPFCELRAFLETDLLPLFDGIVQWATESAAREGLSMNSPIETSERILSPSDFGFHNALRRTDGEIVFFDFEFFGWDDPAKLISDFLLHPGMSLDDDRRKRFVKRLCSELRNGHSVAKRLPMAYSLFAVKWCAILLNEFIPEHLARRRFAGDSRDEKAILSGQLDKARRMAGQIANTYRDFPYGD